MARRRAARETDDVEMSPAKRNTTVARRNGQKPMGGDKFAETREETDWSGKKWVRIFDIHTARLDVIERQFVMVWLRAKTGISGRDVIWEGHVSKGRAGKPDYVKATDEDVSIWQLPSNKYWMWISQRAKVESRMAEEIPELMPYPAKDGDTETERINDKGEKVAKFLFRDRAFLAEQFVKYVIEKMQKDPENFATAEAAEEAPPTHAQLPPDLRFRNPLTPQRNRARPVLLRQVALSVSSGNAAVPSVRVRLVDICNDVPEDGSKDIRPGTLSFEKLYEATRALHQGAAGYFFWEAEEDDSYTIDGDSLGHTVSEMHVALRGETRWEIGWAAGEEQMSSGWRKLV